MWRHKQLLAEIGHRFGFSQRLFAAAFQACPYTREIQDELKLMIAVV